MVTCNCNINSICGLSNNELNAYVKEVINTMLANGDLIRPDDIYMVSQTLVGTLLTTTMSNNVVIHTDLRSLLEGNLSYLKGYVDNILIDLIGSKP